MARATEEEFLTACPRRGPAWETYREVKRDGVKVLLYVTSGDVIAIRTSEKEESK
jgi:hypothetical protein